MKYHGIKTTQGIRVIVCPDTQNEVLYDIKNKICLHNETIELDKRDVQEFLRFNHPNK